MTWNMTKTNYYYHDMDNMTANQQGQWQGGGEGGRGRGECRGKRSLRSGRQ